MSDESKVSVPAENRGDTLARTQTPIAPQDSAPREYALGALKGAIGAIPYAGTLLNELIFETRSRLKQKRAEAFFHSVAERVAALQAEKIDKNYIQSEEFSDLIEELFSRVVRTERQTKRERLEAILVNALQGQRPPELGMVYLDVLDEISDSELVVLQKLCAATNHILKRQAEGVKVEMMPFDYSKPDIMGLAPRDFRLVLQSLIRKGLIYDDSFGRLSTLPYTFARATDLGIAFLAWLGMSAD